MRHTLKLTLALLLLVSTAFAQRYEPGPDITTPMGRELVEIVSRQPNMPALSEAMMDGYQKFRPAFGPTLWRMLLKPNSIKVLFIGQDGTHIAEAAGRTATAGFGGRAQDVAKYFGVSTSAAFINAYAFTIKGQYGAFETPLITRNKKGEVEIDFNGFVGNELWLMSQDQNSPMVKWRNDLIDWIMRNNSESLRMIVLFGGAARDALGSFINSRGGKVGTKLSAEDLKDIRVPDVKLVSAGGNNEFPVILDKDGKDLYAELVGSRLKYSNEEDIKKAQEAAEKNITQILERASFSNIGIEGSGVINPAQLGGFDLEQISINGGKSSRSLKGLTLSNGKKITQELVVVNSPHPTALTMSEMSRPGSASKMIAKALAPIRSFAEKGWTIEPDAGLKNAFAEGKDYQYGRTDLPDAYYCFGTPNCRKAPKSDASRMTGNANVIILGTRQRVSFDMNLIKTATYAQAAPGISAAEMFIARPRTPETAFVFDSGPGEKYAELMVNNIDMNLIGKAKKDMSWKKDGIEAFNIKTHPEDVGPFAYYRGTFSKARVLVLADPDGADDLLTSRALTGTRGQYLHGLMQDAGINDQYLVLKTIPFGMDGATESEWSTVLEQTKEYREKLLREVIKDNKLELILADGDHAALEIERILGDSKIPVINIKKVGLDNNSGLAEAGREMATLPSFKNFKAQGKMANIPRSHLSFYSRVWEGTSGTRVFNTTDSKYKGQAFAIVAPAWAYKQGLALNFVEENSVKNWMSEILNKTPITVLKKAGKSHIPDAGFSGGACLKLYSK